MFVPTHKTCSWGLSSGPPRSPQAWAQKVTGSEGREEEAARQSPGPTCRAVAPQPGARRVGREKGPVVSQGGPRAGRGQRSAGRPQLSL